MNKTSKTTPTSGIDKDSPCQIVFFGTGPVAAASLRLLAEDFAIEAVITKPKPAHHRGSFPVLEVADVLDIPVVAVTDAPDVSSKVISALAGPKFSRPIAFLLTSSWLIATQTPCVYYNKKEEY